MPGSELLRRLPRCRCSISITWHLPLILLRFPPEGSRLLCDSIQKSCSGPPAGRKAGGGSTGCAVPGGCLGFPKSPTCSFCHPGDQVSEDPVHQPPQLVMLTKAVRDRLSLVHQITSPKAVSAL